MPDAPLDPQEFKSNQRELWSSVAAGWKRAWPAFEAGAQELNERLVDLARVGAGRRVLDVATGLGEPALTAARRVGHFGHVVATDLAPQMLELARERARELGVDNVEFIEMDAENLALEPSSFDAAISRWGVMLLFDPQAALEGIRRVLKPAARFATAVWGASGSVPFMTTASDVARRELDLPPVQEGLPGPLTMGKPGQLESALERAGFQAIESESMTLTMTFATADEYVEFLKNTSSTLKRALAGRKKSVQDKVWREIARDAQSFAGKDGKIRFENQVRCAAGQR